jgi:crotonobetainyl-CoA:carnitine CoA-transferase CaiB-like acyl-CoA transferase
MNSLPFEGIKVLELASVLAGPSVGMFFAELGASVLKIESPPAGDVTRSWKLKSEDAQITAPAYFSSVNWGKETLLLDLSLPENRKVIYDKIPEVDIILLSYKPGDALKLGMNWEQLSALNPRLIYGEISGYGADNPRVGYDAIVQAESGFTYMNGEPNGNPVKMPVALMDVLAAHQLKEGILTALYQREKTGKGDYIQVSLIQSGVASLVNQASNYLMAGHIPGRMGSAHPNIVPYGTLYECQEGGQIVLAVGNDKQFYNLLKVLDLSDVKEDVRFQNNPSRVAHRDILEPILKEAIEKRSRAELLEQLWVAQVPAGAVNTMKDVFTMPEAQEMILHQSDKVAVRSVAFHSVRFPWRKEILPPPNL